MLADEDRRVESPALAAAGRAAREAVAEAGWGPLDERCGLVIGTTTGQANYWEPSTIAFLRDGLEDEFVARHRHNPLGILVRELAGELGARGPTQTLASACCASTQAIGIAAHWIASGRVDRCLVGGVELICELTRAGFQSLQLVSPEACRPFDARRAGINLAEACAFLCLEKPAPKAYAHVRGFGTAGDASHMTAPHPEGDGCRRAMLGALRSAEIPVGEVDWIHAHGTGSRHNDIAESKAIRHVFGDGAPQVSSTKGVHGHALGASGALESLLVCRALREGVILPSWGLAEQDPEIALELPRAPVRRPLRHVVKNTLAFGGINASLVFSGSAG
jgi:3-oxoacyl-[acyl-carrier-protein] synthase-1